jgi:hypothetical protein
MPPMTYFDRARARAKRRKSPWNLVLVFACFASWLTLAFALLRANEFIHQLIYAGETLTAHPKGFAVLLATLPLLFASLPFGFIAGNLLVWAIPPIRLVLDQEARPFPDASFLSSQRGLLKMAAYITPPFVALAVIGALLPW